MSFRPGRTRADVSGGRNSADDLYDDVDATRSFDYVLGSNKGGSSC